MTQSSFWQVACHKCWISRNGQREKNLGELQRPKLLNSTVTLRPIRLILRTENIIYDNQVVCDKCSGEATQLVSQEIVWLRWVERTLVVHKALQVQGPTDVNSALFLAEI
uniref:Uncharacterized protein n=1 Tax=Opuntia streptacantha TaxID=393608 RepID=A0A7C9DGN1_OPUST